MHMVLVNALPNGGLAAMWCHMSDPMKLTFNLPSDEEVCHSVKVRGGDHICLWHTKSTAHRLQTAWAVETQIRATEACFPKDLGLH